MLSEENVKERKPGSFEPGNKAAVGRGPNKISTKVKESIVNFLENNVDAIQESFDKLKPKEKLEFISSVLPYAAPKLSSQQIEQETNISGGITIKWEEPPVRNTSDQSGLGELPGV